MIFILEMMKNRVVLLDMGLVDFVRMIRNFILMFVNKIVIFVIGIDGYTYKISFVKLPIYR